jgi:hypothetical protein
MEVKMTQPFGDEATVSDVAETPSDTAAVPATQAELDTVSGIPGGGWGQLPG